MKNQHDCIFCEIIKGNVKSDIVYESEHIIGFLDIDPITNGHVLVIPKKHIQDIHNLDKNLSAELMEAARILSNALKDTFQFDGITLMQNNGIFQDVPHFHLHIFGRSEDQNISIKYPANINSDPSHLKKNATKIKQYIKAIS